MRVSLAFGADGGRALAKTDWRSVVGSNVRERRNQLGMTQNQLAASAGLGRTYLGGIEKGQRNPSLLVLARLAEVLGVDLPDLLAPVTGAR
ncbi:helix-turn-helix transcriptional regulator [Brevundimonas naejangsanensis]|uniref:helix-turn-helix domain-containing protein n=1 Tax=Brevundimonas naejangsanensis TaxID=588932 RepID=UPI00320A649F